MLLNQMRAMGELDDLKRDLVRQYTKGRTESLKEVSDREYYAMCYDLEEKLGMRNRLKEKRSVCLRLMQKVGIDTTDWARINAFCEDVRICGKAFGRMSVKELEEMSVKLRSIERKGGLKPKAETKQVSDAVTMVMSLKPQGEA